MSYIYTKKPPLCKEGCRKSLIFDWGIVSNDILQSHRFAHAQHFPLGKVGFLRHTRKRDLWGCVLDYDIILTGGCGHPPLRILFNIGTGT